MNRRFFVMRAFCLFSAGILPTTINRYFRQNKTPITVHVLCEPLIGNKAFSSIDEFFSYYSEPALSSINADLTKNGFLSSKAQLLEGGKSVMVVNRYSDEKFFDLVKSQVATSMEQKSVRLKYTILKVMKNPVI